MTNPNPFEYMLLGMFCFVFFTRRIVYKERFPVTRKCLYHTILQYNCQRLFQFDTQAGIFFVLIVLMNCCKCFKDASPHNYIHISARCIVIGQFKNDILIFKARISVYVV